VVYPSGAQTCQHRAVRTDRNFGFIDLSGFTALTEAEGDERAVSVLSSFRSIVRDVCSRRGVRVAKWLGDGAMLVTVEPTPLLAGTMEMLRAVEKAGLPTRLRAGASAGEVILHEGDDYIGHAINVAARLCDMAPGGVIYAAPTIVDALPKWGCVLSTDDTVIRGLERPLPVSRIGLRPLEPPTSPDPVCGIPLTRLVAEELVHDAFGQEVWFCSDSCRDTWERRPQPVAEGQGSLRMPLIGT
jgi:adenylate cyclase